MPLTPGRRLGPYEVVGAIGAGGMGEVYRARDTKLGRDVAIKALPDAVAADPERVTRFEREAQLLAALNHPHIATIHGIVEAEGGTFIVLELVDGESLAGRLTAGPIPVLEALAIARQIAEALQAAHLKGIIHRDLKPGNVMLTQDGRVKVLDFGLAKALDPPYGAHGSGPSSSPTFTSPATQMGMILGTAAYMSPEQAKGKAADRRADVWAFGCVLFEMLTGRRAFEGEDVTDTIGAVMRGEPDWSLLPPGLSAAVDTYLRRCLYKNPNDRVQDIGDVRLALDGAFDVPAAMPPAVALAAPRPSGGLIGAAVALAILTGATGWLLKPAGATPPVPIRRFTITPGPAPLAIANTNRDLALTPDGTAIVYIVGQGSSRQVYVRRLDSLTATALRPADRYFEPFVSPDSRWVAFIDETDYTLRKMLLSGGSPVTVATVGREMLGAAWARDDTIVYATVDGLWRVPAAGGVPVAIAKPAAARGELAYGWPEILPDGKTVLFSIRAGSRANDVAIAAVDLQGGTPRVVIPAGTSARYSATGHLLYIAEGALRAVSFDPVRVAVRGDAVPVVEGIAAKGSGAADCAISADGTIVYLAGFGADARRQLVWLDRDGTRQPVNAPPRAYALARVSPDGTRVALEVRDQQADIWVWDIARETLTRLTNDAGFDGLPVWTRDSRAIVFNSARRGPLNMFVQAADGSGEVRRLFESAVPTAPTSITPDGQHVIFSVDRGDTQQDIMRVPLDGGRAPEPILVTRANERNAEVSPDGKWLAYESDESGQTEIYVRPFPAVQTGRWQVSYGGGAQPAWASGGRELVYVTKDARLAAVGVVADTVFTASKPKDVTASQVYASIAARSYDVSPDGRRFLVIEPVPAGTGDSQSASISVVLNWADELKRLLPRR